MIFSNRKKYLITFCFDISYRITFFNNNEKSFDKGFSHSREFKESCEY